MTTINRGNVYGAGFMMAAGLGLLLARYVGFTKVWFLYPLAAGILMMVAPWATGAEQVRNSRIAGAWMATGGVVSGLVLLTELSWANLGPVWMVGAGLTALIWNRKAA